jgi:phospholipid-binding lipoprotein MlaA
MKHLLADGAAMHPVCLPRVAGVLRRLGCWSLLGAVLLAAGGCASIPPNAGNNPADPLERLNRHVYVFNDRFDRGVAQPVARGYTNVVPRPVRNCVGNFFANLGEITNAVNAALQLKVTDAGTAVGRLIVNSTVGLLGCFDVAKSAGLERNRQDFGLTLGNWGLPPGPYLVIPFYGPSSVRDAIGEVPDYYTDPVRFVNPKTDYYLVYGTRFVDRRSQFLDTGRLVDDAALDPYAFVRDGYLQRRRSRIYDGNPPPSTVDEDPDSPSFADPAGDGKPPAFADPAGEGKPPAGSASAGGPAQAPVK